MDVSRIRVINQLGGCVRIKVIDKVIAEFDAFRSSETEVGSEYMRRVIEIYIKPVDGEKDGPYDT